jgi:uncharacterized protein (UPF0332 family)
LVSVILPGKIEKKLREESKKTGASQEELIIEALSKALNEPLDVDAKVEVHLKLSKKFIDEAEGFLGRGHFVQASEKAWGVASQIVKAVAASKGEELRSHRELHEYVAKLSREEKDREILNLWFSATSLHQNFYEDWLPEDVVRNAIENVKMFREKLVNLINRSPK